MNKQSTKSSKLTFDPDKSFFELAIVRQTAGAFILIAAISFGLITMESGLFWKWDFSYAGFNNFLDYYKFPLGFLALSIPVGAVYAANHRSVQTKRQIILTNKQNLFTNYYKHLEEFEKFATEQVRLVAGQNSASVSIKNINIRHTHKVLFPDLMNTGDYFVHNEFMEQIEDICVVICTEDYSNKSISEAKSFIETHYGLLIHLLAENELSLNTFTMSNYNNKSKDVSEYYDLQKLHGLDDQLVKDVCSAYKILDILHRIRITLKIFSQCAKFDSSYHGSEILSELNANSVQIKPQRNGKPISAFNTEVLLRITPLKDDYLTPAQKMNSSFHDLSREELVDYTWARINDLRERLKEYKS